MYMNLKVNDCIMNLFKVMLLLNWIINYNGLMKFDFVKKYVKNFVICYVYIFFVFFFGVQSNFLVIIDVNGNVMVCDVNNNFYVFMMVMIVIIFE